MLTDALRQQFDDLVNKNEVVLFMKGNKHFPQCGFSAQVVGILKQMGTKFESVNVLADPAVRDGIKEYSNWPTIPQLYVKGEFVGGCDIVKEMFATGELQKKLGVQVAQVSEGKPASAPDITLDDGAAKAIKAADEGNGEMLRLEISADFQYELYFGPKEASDLVSTSNGVSILFDAASAERAKGLRISWVETADGGAFKIENPNEPARVKSLSAPEVKAWLDQGKSFEFFDVRGEDERKIAKIEQAKPLDAAGEKHLAGVAKDTPIVFHCHHGMRSRNAAERFLREGYTNLYNLEGGIEAWSQKVDPKVARY
ncbi:putative monothiol glutaredoxin ycf64-like [Labilithrix luteola]|uniref:Probable monothiol glutaredoxin 2 n=1 Tax=Labilithrix luteola TaxID=1391654 RepID=A0A0K1PNQ1_9BACT|nr:Grx4 family monothiol glutaredoxin [Labilithrix luteola]AKU95147.1 putative monothiol glutaredoxin ycf64-like [Labilithrix luteola]